MMLYRLGLAYPALIGSDDDVIQVWIPAREVISVHDYIAHAPEKP